VRWDEVLELDDKIDERIGEGKYQEGKEKGKDQEGDDSEEKNEAEKEGDESDGEEVKELRVCTFNLCQFPNKPIQTRVRLIVQSINELKKQQEKTRRELPSAGESQPSLCRPSR